MGRHQGHRKLRGGGNKNGHGQNFDDDRQGCFTFHCGGGGTFHQRVSSSRPGKDLSSVTNCANANPPGAVGGYESAAHGAMGATSKSKSRHQHRRDGRGRGRWHKRGRKTRGQGATAHAAGENGTRGGKNTTERESTGNNIKRKYQAHNMLDQAKRSNEAGMLPAVPRSCGGSVNVSVATAASNEPGRIGEGGAAATKGEKIETDNEAGVIIEEQARRAEKKIGLPVEGQELCSERQIRPHLTWHRACEVGPGFANLGNTCFLNSILQCLSYLPPLAQHLLNDRHSQENVSASGPAVKGCADIGNSDVLGAMQRLIEQVHQVGPTTAQQTIKPTFFFHNIRLIIGSRFRRGRQVHQAGPTVNQQTIKPTFFSHNINLIGDRFQRGRQEDAHEFLRHLVDRLAGSYLECRDINPFAPNRLAETTPIHRIFGGYLRSQLKCPLCGHCSDKFDSFMDLSLDIEKMGPNGKMKKFRSLNAALKSFTSTETLGSGNEWGCGGCEKRVEAEKTLSVFKPPNALVVQLKRFGFAGSTAKIRSHVHFEEKLDLDVSGPERRVAYDLTGVVVHNGNSISGGHYLAYVRSSNGWAKMNDDVVTPVKLATVLKEEAYVLFYKRHPASSPLLASGSVTPSPSSRSSSTAAGDNGCSSVSDGSGQPPPSESKTNRKRRRKQEREAGLSSSSEAAAAAATAQEAAALAAEVASAGAEAATNTSAEAASTSTAPGTGTVARTTVAVAAENDELDEGPKSKKPRGCGNARSAETGSQNAGVVTIPPEEPALIPEHAGRSEDDSSADCLGGDSDQKCAPEKDNVGEGVGAAPRVVSPSTSPPLPSVVKIPSDAIMPGAITGKRSREDGASPRSSKIRRLIRFCTTGIKLPGLSPSIPQSPPGVAVIDPLPDAVSGAVNGKRAREDGVMTETEAGTSGLPQRIPTVQRVGNDNGTKPTGSPSTYLPPPSVVRPLNAVSSGVSGVRPREKRSPPQTEADPSEVPLENPKIPKRKVAGIRVQAHARNTDRSRAYRPRLAKKGR